MGTDQPREGIRARRTAPGPKGVGCSPSCAPVLLGDVGHVKAAVRLGFLARPMGLMLVPVGRVGQCPWIRVPR